jgi:hypothetical protein
MMAPDCPREPEVVAAIVAGRWPDQCDEALPVHAASCHVCRDLAEVASLLHDDVLDEGVTVPAAGQVWWRAAIRARLEATHAVSRPLSWMSGAAVACAVGLAAASIGLVWPAVQEAATWTSLLSWPSGLISGPVTDTLAPVLRVSGLVAISAVTFIVLAPLLLYLALSDDES